MVGAIYHPGDKTASTRSKLILLLPPPHGDGAHLCGLLRAIIRPDGSLRAISRPQASLVSCDINRISIQEITIKRRGRSRNRIPVSDALIPFLLPDVDLCVFLHRVERAINHFRCQLCSDRSRRRAMSVKVVCVPKSTLKMNNWKDARDALTLTGSDKDTDIGSSLKERNTCL